MKILHLTDTPMALAPARFVDLINKYTKEKADLIQLKSLGILSYYQFENHTEEEIISLLQEADVLHFHGVNIFNRRRINFNGKLIDISPYLRKLLVLHYHGSPQRENYLRFQKYGINLLLSTPEMIPMFPQGVFFPNLIDEKDNIYTRGELKKLGDPIKVCHHFSFHRRVKNTTLFLQTQKEIFNLNKQNKIVLDYLPQLEFTEILKKRATYDIVFDHLQGYYGLISVEGLAQGVMVINGCGERSFYGLKTNSMTVLTEFLGAPPPFFVTTEADFLKRLLKLDHEVINDYKQRGIEFIKNFWSGEKLIHKLINYYKGL